MTGAFDTALTRQRTAPRRQPTRLPCRRVAACGWPRRTRVPRPETAHRIARLLGMPTDSPFRQGSASSRSSAAEYRPPGETYTPDGPDRNAIQINYNSTVKLGAFQRSGTLDQWKKHVAKTCEYSSRARLAVAAVFAAPNLRPLKVNTFGFNFSGPTSGGKTFLLGLATSGAGLNSNEGPETWDGSAPGFEQRALGHRDSMMPLDDLSHLAGDATHVAQLAKLVTFRLASNRPKTLARQYVQAHNLVDTDWRVIPLSTSEDPLWDQVSLHGRGNRRVRGEEVRMINVRASVWTCPSSHWNCERCRVCFMLSSPFLR